MITVTELRKTFTAQGIKGAGKWKREDFTSTIITAEFAAYAEAEARDEAAKVAELQEIAKAPIKKTNGKNICGICSKRRNYTGNAGGEKAPRLSEMCNPCYAEGGWENTHSDAGHEAILATPEADRTGAQLEEIDGCWICYPELNRAQKPQREGRSRAGMVIVAKGSEIHKSQVFWAAAEAAGWTVTVQGDEETGRYYADAHKGAEAIQLAWEGRAYDYSASSARINGKDRKVRNLKEALRLL